LTLLLAGTGAVDAQSNVKVRIDDARVGFKVRGDIDAYKGGIWTPVYVDLTAGGERIENGEADLVLETSDADDMQNTYAVRLPALEPKEQRTVITYARPGYHGTDISVSVVSKKDGRVYSHYKQQARYDAMPPYGVLYLCVGSPLSGFKRALAAEQPKPKQNAASEGGAQIEEDVEIDTGSLRVASVNSVQQLPTRWFGYSSVDVLFLTSGSETFVKELLEDQQNHKEAMAEWVRRGGRIVISAGRNQQFVAQLLAKMGLVDCPITSSLERRVLSGVSEWGGRAWEARGRDGAVTDISVAKLEPGPGVATLLTERKTGEKPFPLVVTAPSGLGRVMIVAFDLDVQPFAGWSGQTKFWEQLHKQIDPPDAAHRVTKDSSARTMGLNADPNELGTRLYDSLQQFPDVPVVPFGWVALFILLYILVVGPLDYYFLKKVVKRLELTWITFPAVVIVVSTAAYFTAYYLKGNDMRINKVDVVDIDLRSPQIYGSTWFTIFSPRIQHYTIGVEPASGVWTMPSAKGSDYSVNVGWFGRLESNPNTLSRGGSAGLFRRAYEYAPEASGLTGVPIQVWALKAFTASWQAPLPAGQDTLFSAALQASPDGRRVSGTITSNLPADLVEAVAFFGGKTYSLRPLKAGETMQLEPMGPDSGAQQAQTWIGNRFNPKPRGQAGNQFSQSQGEVNDFIKSVLFHGETGSSNDGNSSLRHLDQGWRVRVPAGSLDEIMICGRLTPQEGAAETVAQSGASASRLWLGKLPSATGPPPPLTGTLSQDTYVRIYIPVKR
jgi:hypothetical protein